MVMNPIYRQTYQLLLLALFTLVTLLGVLKVNATDRQFGAPQYLGTGFTLPIAIAFDTARERVFVLSSGDHQIAYASLEAARDGGDWTVVGAIPDRSSIAALNAPEGLAIDSSGNIFVADTFNNRAVMYRYNSSNDTYVLDTSFASDTSTSVNGLPISRPRDIVVAPDDSIYLLDSGNRRILRAINANAHNYTVVHRNEAWAYPYGLDVDESNTIYVADTHNHRIIRVAPDGVETEFGQYGRRPGDLRYPKDVAVSPSGLIVVADTHNHRLAIFDTELHYFRALGQPPLLRNPTSIAIDSQGRVFVADIEREDGIAYLGPDVDPQFDGFIRDNLDDEGVPPTLVNDGHDSPDILVSLSSHFDLNELESIEFETLSSEAVVPGGIYYLYFAIRNLGDRSMPPSISVYSSSEDTSEPLYQFPEEWRTNETFLEARGTTPRHQKNRLSVASVPANGKTVVGPLEWRPSGTTDQCDSNKFLMARLVNLYDSTIRESDNGLEQALASNNIAVRTVPFVSADCIPLPDEFEFNDLPEDAAPLSTDWNHLHAVCPRYHGRHPYPQENSCENIFEDGVTARFAEEIWTLSVNDLSLHSGLDRDFFSLDLPDFFDPEYQVNDITQERIRGEFSDSPSYLPSPMPECGVVRRHDPGPAGADREVTVRIETELLIEIVPEEPPSNNVSPRPIDPTGEELFVYTESSDGLMRDATIVSGEELAKRIVCPRDLHGLDDLVFSFGERMDPITARELTSTGRYRIDATYLSSIDRGFQIGPRTQV
ncbi:MAG: hypothetical protein GKR95_16975 [Gammaproteobacteria bacterium]|nr:hypothetical protein [Gammaproteobacteria bacterium]